MKVVNARIQALQVSEDQENTQDFRARPSSATSKGDCDLNVFGIFADIFVPTNSETLVKCAHNGISRNDSVAQKFVMNDYVAENVDIAENVNVAENVDVAHVPNVQVQNVENSQLQNVITCRSGLSNDCRSENAIDESANRTNEKCVSCARNSINASVVSNIGDPSSVLANALSSLADVLVSRDNLPKMMPEEFRGDVLSYPTWVQSFEAIVEKNATTLSQKMFFLGKCTSGEAKEAIKGYLSLNTEDAYLKARETLNKRYGDKYLLAKECKKKISNWNTISYGNGKALREFSDFLLHCKTIMKSTQHLQSLNSEEEITKILKKVPRNISEKFARIIDGWLHHDNPNMQRYPSFDTLCDFLEKEARILITATASRPLEEHGRQFHRTNDRKREPARQVTMSTNVNGDSETQRKCFICSYSHMLADCPQFKKMTLGDRRETLKKKGICFACLSGHHLSKDCRRRKTCEICKKGHATLLHDENYYQKGSEPDANQKNSATVHTSTVTTQVSKQSWS
jgi:hypothetical protein